MIACPKCGNESADSAHFCGFCGAKLLGAAPSQTIFGMQAAVKRAPSTAPPPPAAPAPAPEPPPAPERPLASPSPAPATSSPPDAILLEPSLLDVPEVEPLDETQPLRALAPQAPAAVEVPKPLPSPKGAARDPLADKADEEAFFGASLSQYDLKGMSREELLLNDVDARTKGRAALPIIVAALLLGALTGAVVYFVALR